MKLKKNSSNRNSPYIFVLALLKYNSPNFFQSKQCLVGPRVVSHELF